MVTDVTGPVRQVQVLARIRPGDCATAAELARRLGAAREEGASGVVLETGEADGAGVPETLQRNGLAAALVPSTGPSGEPTLDYLVEVRSIHEARWAFESGASGVLVGAPDAAAAVVDLAVSARPGDAPLEVWVPSGAAGKVRSGSGSGVVVVSESTPEHFLRIVQDRGLPPPGEDGGHEPACVLPPSSELGPGELEALATLAVTGGAMRLRTHDPRVVRRCAHVAAELVAARHVEASTGRPDTSRGRWREACR